MQDYERYEILRIPKKYRPIGAWGYFWLNILFSIPVVGFVSLFCMALFSGNICRRSYARSFFCWLLVSLILFGIGAAIVFGMGAQGALITWFRNLIGK